MKHILILPATALALALCQCNQPESGESETATGTIPDILTATAPAGAIGVASARTQAQPGEPITLRGKVGGKMTPLSETAAILVLADEETITSCDDIPGDSCETPWDYCCEDSDKITASTATIQVRDADGKVLRSTLRGLGGLKELSHLVVSGTVDAASTEAALIVNADTIHVEKP